MAELTSSYIFIVKIVLKVYFDFFVFVNVPLELIVREDLWSI